MNRTLIIAAFFFTSFIASAQDSTSVAVTKAETTPMFMATANVNYSRRLSTIENTFTTSDSKYLKNLKDGVSYDFGVYLMFDEYAGLGFKYNIYKASGSALDAPITAANGDTGFGRVSDDITISFYGLSVIQNVLHSGGKHKLFLDATIGYMHYKNEAYALGSYTISRGALGSSLTASYQYEPFKNFMIGPKVGWEVSTIGKVKIEGPDGFEETRKFAGNKKELLFMLNAGIAVSYRF